MTLWKTIEHKCSKIKYLRLNKDLPTSNLFTFTRLIILNKLIYLKSNRENTRFKEV